MNLNNKNEEKQKEEETHKRVNPVSERLKQMQNENNKNNIAKKQEKVHVKFNEPNKKEMDDNSKNIRNIVGINNIKKEDKDLPKVEPKKINPFFEKNNKINNLNTIKKEEKLKPLAANNKFGFGFADKLKHMNELFKNQGKDSQRRGHSVMAPSSRLGFGNSRHNWKDAGSNNLGIINEEPDRMKPGYSPTANLQKKLDKIVVDKRKRKKTIAAFKG